MDGDRRGRSASDHRACARPQRAALLLGVSALLLCAGAGPAGAARTAARAAMHDACSAPNSAHVPCRFSTPSGNVRCLWLPVPNSVTCELLSSGRAYRLRPTGSAKAVGLKLTHRGVTLPTSQTIVFPESLSCRDTRTTMTCNQDEGLGSFRLSPKGSHHT